MPITPFLKEAVFEPETVRLMASVLTRTCQTIEDSGQEVDAVKAILARCIIHMVQTGITDPEVLYQSALEALPVALRRVG